MEPTVLEKSSNLATEKLKEIKAPEVEKAQAEATAAAEVKAKADAEEQKAKESELAKLEAQAKKDESILAADEATLPEEDKARKSELLKKKEEFENTPEAKIKRVKEESQKRIDEIKSELLDSKNKSSQEIAALRAELAEVKKSVEPRIQEDAKAQEKRLEQERINKYVEEDKSKNREDRREMSKDELEAWYLEDPIEATAWVQERTMRRADERKKSVEVKNTGDESKRLAEDFVAKQKASADKLLAKYPSIRPSAETIAKYPGKSQAEIIAAISAEDEVYRLCNEIVASDPKKYLESVDGPELVMAEIDKRLAKPVKTSKVELTEDELEAKIQAEVERRKRLDEGLNSTGGKKVENKETQKSENRTKLEAIAKRANIPMADLEKTMKRRESIAGANTFEDGNG